MMAEISHSVINCLINCISITATPLSPPSSKAESSTNILRQFLFNFYALKLWVLVISKRGLGLKLSTSLLGEIRDVVRESRLSVFLDDGGQGV